MAAPPGAPGSSTPAAESAATGGIRVSDGNSVAWRRAEILSGSGHGNARSVAAVQSVLACGGEARGVRLLSPEGCGRAREEQYRGVDQILGRSVRYGLGYGIFDPACGWAGWGGSMVMVDLDACMTVAYVMNRCCGRTTGASGSCWPPATRSGKNRTFPGAPRARSE